jgi:hypothetical protein
MGNDNNPAGNGHGGDTRPTPVPGHKSYGSETRNEVGGGPAGRGNDTGATVDTARDWGRGLDVDEKSKPVDKPAVGKNPFSP